MSPRPRLIALDLDGTLLNSRKELTPRTVAAVQAAAAAGIVCLLASGRMYRHCMEPHVAALGLKTPVIAYNGAVILDPGSGRILSEQPVEAAIVDQTIAAAAATGRHLNLYHDDTLYCQAANQWSQLYVDRTGAQPVYRDDLYTWFAGRPSTKCLFIDAPEVIEAMCAEWRERLGDTAYVTVSDAEYLEITNPAATKGWALRTVCAQFGIDPAEAAAFGDSGNDLPMLQAAGQGWAMANARESIRAAATHLAPDHDEDGVAQVIEAWLA